MHYFLNFALKHGLWVLVRTASMSEAVLTCTHNPCFEQKYHLNIKFHLKIIILTAVKSCSILHGRVVKSTEGMYVFVKSEKQANI